MHNHRGHSAWHHHHPNHIGGSPCPFSRVCAISSTLSSRRAHSVHSVEDRLIVGSSVCRTTSSTFGSKYTAIIVPSHPQRQRTTLAQSKDAQPAARQTIRVHKMLHKPALLSSSSPSVCEDDANLVSFMLIVGFTDSHTHTYLFALF